MGKSSKYKNTYMYVDDRTLLVTCWNKRFFLIDAEDFHLLGDHYWSVDKFGYVQTNMRGKCVVLSRLLMNAPQDKYVDHINHKPFDNRKQNLRVCTPSENARNQTAFDPYGCRRGIKKNSGFFTAVFNHRSIRRSARFKTYSEAVAQRTQWEEEFFGEFAPWDRYDEEKNRFSELVFCHGAPRKERQWFWRSPFESETIDMYLAQSQS